MISHVFGIPLQRLAVALGAVYLSHRLLKLLMRRKLRKDRWQSSPEHVLIIGASSGVGRALARHYASTKCRNLVKLGLVARRGAKEALAEVQQAGVHDAWEFSADVSSPEQVLALGSFVTDRWDRVDTIIVCAGALTVQPVLCLTEQTRSTAPTLLAEPAVRSPPDLSKLKHLATIARASYDANVTPALLMTSGLLHLMASSEAPRVAVLSSVAAEIAAPTRAFYSGSKAALSMIMKSLRYELGNLRLPDSQGRRSVGITIVNPASISTGLRGSALDALSSDVASEPQSERKAMSPDYVAAQTVRAIDTEVDELWLPSSYWWISKYAQILLPGVVKRGAFKKYGFQ